MTDHESSPRRRRRPTVLLAAVALFGIGGAVGGAVVATSRPSVTMAPATPVAIRSLGADGIVTIRGRVAEVYGNKFVMADAGGRALVDLGRDGESGTLVATGEPVTVQGRFDDGFVRAAFLVGPDGTVRALGPLGGPHHDRHGSSHPDRDRDGPDLPPSTGPTPPPPTGGA